MLPAREVSKPAGEVELASFKAKRIFLDGSATFGKWRPAGREASTAGAEASDDFSKATSPRSNASTAGIEVSTPLANASTTFFKCPKSKTEWSTTVGQWTTVLGQWSKPRTDWSKAISRTYAPPPDAAGCSRAVGWRLGAQGLGGLVEAGHHLKGGVDALLVLG